MDVKDFIVGFHENVLATSALKTTLLVKHFPSVGQFTRCRQLQSFSSFLLSLLVCFFQNDFIVLVHV